MNWSYGKASRQNRDTCSEGLIRVIDRGLSLSPVDIAIIWGWRGEQVQTGLFRSGASEKEWPFSEHNFMQDDEPCSKAFDFAPYVNGIPWEDTHSFALVAGVFMAAASIEGVILRWGGDWDMDGLTIDQTFMDYGHMEEEK